MASAFSGARKNRQDLSVGIALGSASQIALFVAAETPDFSSSPRISLDDGLSGRFAAQPISESPGLSRPPPRACDGASRNDPPERPFRTGPMTLW
jgi:hypothetical protein